MAIKTLRVAEEEKVVVVVEREIRLSAAYGEDPFHVVVVVVADAVHRSPRLRRQSDTDEMVAWKKTHSDEKVPKKRRAPNPKRMTHVDQPKLRLCLALSF